MTSFADRSKFDFGKPDSPVPLSDNDKKRLSVALSEVRANRKLFLDFAQEVDKEAELTGQVREAREELEKVSRYVAGFHSAFLHAYFPDLVTEALAERTSETKAYIQHVLASSESADDAKAKLQPVANQLTCLTNIAVGPAFDRKYLVPKLPKNQPTVKGSDSSKTPKRSQRYLLPPDEATE